MKVVGSHGIGLYKPCLNLPFGDRAMYFDHGVPENDSQCLVLESNSPTSSQVTTAQARKKLAWNLKINPL